MHVNVVLKNYRCFSDQHPARFEIRDGFTALVGLNNSGKSTLLKFFYELRQLFGSASKPKSLLKALRSPRGLELSTGFDPSQAFFNGNDRDIHIDLNLPEADPEKEHCSIEIVIGRQVKTMTMQIPEFSGIPKDSLGLFEETYLQASPTKNSIATKPEDRRSISGLVECFDALSRCLYIGPFRNAVNAGGNTQYFDIQIGANFVDQWNTLKTGPNAEQNQLAIRVTDTISDLFNFSRLEINATSDKKSLQLAIDGVSYKLDEVGSGIAQFIVVIVNAAVKKPSFVLIDEPELNLHASLQMRFLTALAFFASNGVVFSTHSMGLARSSAERVYTISQTTDGAQLVPLNASVELPEMLGEIGFSGYRELGFEKVLLVEGSTEILAIQQLLRLYKKERTTVLLSLGGSDMINASTSQALMELKRICGDVSAIIDSERTCSGGSIQADRLQFKSNCEAAGINCHILDRRAFENYLPSHSVKKALGNSFEALGEFDLLKESNNGWAKGQNWRIAMQMETADLEGTDLHDFLRSL